MPGLTKANVTAFLRRDWAAARSAKDRSLARFVRARGADAAFRLEQALLEQVWTRIARDPETGKDVSGLIALTELFARANAEDR